MSARSTPRRAFLASVAALGGIAIGCGHGGAAAQSEGVYDATGVVREIRAERRSVTIHHDPVPGYMPEMTMPFDVEDMAILEGIQVGARVRFRFRAARGGHHVSVEIHPR
ncbi:MAG: copper-binding protein [Sandaracinaceae bacterium]